MMLFKGWQKTSLIEYPGKVSTVLFTPGCNFRCPFCYNTDLVLRPEKLPDITGESVLRYLKENRKLYQAVMVSGGEPTIHPGLEDFLGKVKGMGFLVGIETNGTNPDMLGRLLEGRTVDFVGMDIKAPLTWERYRKAARIRDRSLFLNVKKSVRILLKSRIEYEFRTTVVPAVHKKEDVIQIAKQIKGAKRYVLQKFVPGRTLDKRFAKRKPYTSGEMLELKNRIEGYFGSCEARNV